MIGFLWLSDDSSSVQDRCLLHSLNRPQQADVVEAINQAAEVARQQQRSKQ
jgi:hypothetical protein